MRKKLRKERVMLLSVSLLAVLALCIGLIAWMVHSTGGSSSTDQVSQNSEESANSSTENPQENPSALITVTGDVLLEDPIMNYFGSGDWKDYMDDLKPIFEADALTITNQEVPIGGEELGIEGIDYRLMHPMPPHRI